MKELHWALLQEDALVQPWFESKFNPTRSGRFGSSQEFYSYLKICVKSTACPFETKVGILVNYCVPDTTAQSDLYFEVISTLE